MATEVGKEKTALRPLFVEGGVLSDLLKLIVSVSIRTLATEGDKGAASHGLSLSHYGYCVKAFLSLSARGLDCSLPRREAVPPQ